MGNIVSKVQIMQNGIKLTSPNGINKQIIHEQYIFKNGFWYLDLISF